MQRVWYMTLEMSDFMHLCIHKSSLGKAPHKESTSKSMHSVTCIISCYLCFNKLPFYFGFLTDQLSYYSLQQNSG